MEKQSELTELSYIVAVCSWEVFVRQGSIVQWWYATLNLQSEYFTWSSGEWPHTCLFWELVLELYLLLCQPPQQYAEFDSSSKLLKSHESDEGTPLLTESIRTKKKKSTASKIWKRGETLHPKHVTTEWIRLDEWKFEKGIRFLFLHGFIHCCERWREQWPVHAFWCFFDAQITQGVLGVYMPSQKILPSDSDSDSKAIFML